MPLSFHGTLFLLLEHLFTGSRSWAPPRGGVLWPLLGGGERNLIVFFVVGLNGRDEGACATAAALSRRGELCQLNCVYTHIHQWDCHAARLRLHASPPPFSAGVGMGLFFSYDPFFHSKSVASFGSKSMIIVS